MLNDNEGEIIMPFIKYASEQAQNGNSIYRLYFENGEQLIARYDGYTESDNGLDLDEEEYEEFYEFEFLIIKPEKKNKETKWRKYRYLLVNYHNFPTKWEILEGYQLERVKQCDCCLNITLPRISTQEVCPDCGWRENGYLKENPNEKCYGLNLSLNEAREKWNKYHKNIRDC